MNRKRSWLIFFIVTLGVIPAGTGHPAALDQTPLPLVPLIVEYEYAPQYFMQFLNDHPQYARIEASLVDNARHLVLTEKSGRRVNYCDNEARVNALKRGRLEARLTKIDYRETNNFGEPPSHEFAFTDERGQAVRWRFLLAAPPSEQGSGMTPQNSGSGWVLVYRDLGTLATEGTAVQIGSKVIEAEPWPEISAPPYFVAYRGFYIEGAGIGVVLPGTENWRVTSSPKELSEGAQWTMTDDRGRTRQWRVVARRGDEVTINELTGQAPIGALSLKARVPAQGLALRAIELTSRKKSLRFSFTPELDLSAAAPSATFQIDENGHDKVMQGSVSGERRDGGLHLRWQPQSPDWAKSRRLTSTVTTTATGYKIEVR